LNSFDGWEFTLFDLIHGFLKTTIFTHNFLNFGIKKYTFGLFDNAFKVPPIFDLLWDSVSLKLPLILLVLSWFQVFYDINSFWMLEPNFVSIISEFLYCLFENFFAWDILCIKPLDSLNKFSNEIPFFFTILDDCILFGLNMLFNYCNINGKQSIVW